MCVCLADKEMAEFFLPSNYEKTYLVLIDERYNVMLVREEGGGYGFPFGLVDTDHEDFDEDTFARIIDSQLGIDAKILGVSRSGVIDRQTLTLPGIGGSPSTVHQFISWIYTLPSLPSSAAMHSAISVPLAYLFLARPLPSLPLRVNAERIARLLLEESTFNVHDRVHEQARNFGLSLASWV